MWDLPNEIWFLVLSFIPIPHLIKAKRVNKRLYSLIKSMILEIQVMISLSPSQYLDPTMHHSFPHLIKVKPFIRMFPSAQQQCWVHLDTNAIDQTARSRLHQFVLDQWPNGKIRFRRLLLSNDYQSTNISFPEITFVSPNVNVLHTVENQLINVELLDFMEVGARIDLRPLRSCNQLKSMALQGSARRLYQETTQIFNASDFRDLPHTLETLHFYGPWLEKWILNYMDMFSIMAKLENLTYLMIDLDFQTLGGDIILDLFCSLPKLKKFGRLGRVDKQFWRMCPKAIGHKLTMLSVGCPKNPYVTPLNRQSQSTFLTSLGLGVVWFAPSIIKLEIWMGYEADQYRLIEALSRIKEGPSWELDSNVKVKRLKKINIFEVSDIASVDDRAWKKLATIPVSNPIKILIGSQDTYLEGTSKSF
jgi:hypothetical protein